MNLDHQVAIVTGASREIGAAMAEALAGAGAAVLVAHHGKAERAAAVVARIRAAGGRAETHNADLRSVAANQDMIARAVEIWGRLDILAANAGLGYGNDSSSFKPYYITLERSTSFSRLRRRSYVPAYRANIVCPYAIRTLPS